MRSRSDRVRVTRAAAAALALLALPAVARATPMTFHLDVRDALASVDAYNAFLVSLGKSAKGVKLVPGGTTFAGQTCAAFGTVFQLGSITVLRGTTAFARFGADVSGSPDANGRYRFLIEIDGRTSSNDGALVAKGDRRCFTFVDVAPVDLNVLNQLVDANVANPNVNGGLKARIANVQSALDQRNIQGALDTLAVFVSSVISRLTSLDPSPTIANAKARLLTEAAFRVRRGILFSPASAQCGNGVRETGEACDGADLGGFDCTTLGFQSGTLACDATCRLDTTGCVKASVCGNGILEAGEECDNGSANSDTVPDACRTNCVRAYCGDGVIDSFEDCEGHNLNGETCVDLGYDGGTLKCDAEECVFDDDNCTIEGE
jgi:hypothetical protein